MMAAKFDFNDFLKQFQAMNNMGGMQMMKLLPGMAQVGVGGLWVPEWLTGNSGRVLCVRGQRSLTAPEGDPPPLSRPPNPVPSPRLGIPPCTELLTPTASVLSTSR